MNKFVPNCANRFFVVWISFDDMFEMSSTDGDVLFASLYFGTLFIGKFLFFFPVETVVLAGRVDLQWRLVNNQAQRLEEAILHTSMEANELFIDGNLMSLHDDMRLSYLCQVRLLIEADISNDPIIVNDIDCLNLEFVNDFLGLFNFHFFISFGVFSGTILFGWLSRRWSLSECERTSGSRLSRLSEKSPGPDIVLIALLLLLTNISLLLARVSNHLFIWRSLIKDACSFTKSTSVSK